jgi:hypothetical protein
VLRAAAPAFRVAYDPSVTYSLSRQRLTVALGFLFVALGWIGYITLIWVERSVSPGGNYAMIIFGVGSVLGYAVLAAASWSWFKWIQGSLVQLSGLVNVLRLFAIANLLLAVGVGALGYFWSHEAVTQPYDGRSTIAAAMTYGFECIGFLLAAVAFWDASAHVRVVSPDFSAPEDELITT